MQPDSELGASDVVPPASQSGRDTPFVAQSSGETGARGDGRSRNLNLFMCGLAAAASAASIAVDPGAPGWIGAGLAILMIAIAATDARYFIIPDELTAAAFALALFEAELRAPEWSLAPIAGCVLRGAILALLFQALRIGYAKLRGRQGLGFGDVKLAAVAGAWLDWSIVPIVLEIAALAALAVYVVRQRALGHALRATGRLPFGLFFAPAIWIGWLLNATLLDHGMTIWDWPR